MVCFYQDPQYLPSLASVSSQTSQPEFALALHVFGWTQPVFSVCKYVSEPGSQ